MISKIIGCADIHIKNVEDIDVLGESLDLFVEDVKKISEEESKKGNEVRVVIAGDIFDQKITVTNEAQMLAYKFFRSLDQVCKTYVIAGNHDYIVNNTDRLDSLTPIFQMSKFKQILYLDAELGYDSGIYVDDNVVFHLYSSFSGFTPTFAESVRIQYPDKVHVGIIHGDVQGATTYTNFVADKGVDPNTFKGLDFVVAGHIHKRQVIKKNGVPIIYCSSITQKNFGEGITGHGYVVWDLNNDNSYEFVDLPIVKGYYGFEITSEKDFENDKEILTNL